MKWLTIAILFISGCAYHNQLGDKSMTQENEGDYVIYGGDGDQNFFYKEIYISRRFDSNLNVECSNVYQSVGEHLSGSIISIELSKGLNLENILAMNGATRVTIGILDPNYIQDNNCQVRAIGAGYIYTLQEYKKVKQIEKREVLPDWENI